jgi:hypothetical protein
MDLREVITLIISFIAMIVLMGRGAWDKSKAKKQQQQQQGSGDAQEDYTLEEFLSGISNDMKKQPKKKASGAVGQVTTPPPPSSVQVQKKASHRSTKDDFQFQTKLDRYQQKSQVADRVFMTEVEERPYSELGDHIVSEDLVRTAQDDAYAIKEEIPPSRAHRLVTASPVTLRQMVLYHEIFGLPKALR